jgi:hypothetical protein
VAIFLPELAERAGGPATFLHRHVLRRELGRSDDATITGSKF